MTDLPRQGTGLTRPDTTTTTTATTSLTCSPLRAQTRQRVHRVYNTTSAPCRASLPTLESRRFHHLSTAKMRDPFPIAPIPALSEAVQPWADYLSLPTLPLHIHEIIISAAFYQFVNVVVSPVLSNRFFPAQYNSLSRTKKLNWDVHVVSLVQSTGINALALWVMFTDEDRWSMDVQERVYGYTGGCALIQALATGYFLWDLVITVSNMHIFGLGMLAHAVSALAVYSCGFVRFPRLLRVGPCGN